MRNRVKFGKNLFNFVGRAVAAFVWQGRGTMYKLGVMMIKVGILDRKPFMVSILTLSGIFNEKVGPFSEICA